MFLTGSAHTRERSLFFLLRPFLPDEAHCGIESCREI